MKMLKKTCIMILVIALLAIFCQSSVIVPYAQAMSGGATATATGGTSFDSISVGTIVSGASDDTGAARSINKMIGAVLTVVQVIGVGVAVIMLVVLAIKYIAASPGDKAEIKKHAVVYVVGAVVLFAASGILGIIRKFAGNISAA